jgi:PAS domain S-box-containing protein
LFFAAERTRVSDVFVPPEPIKGMAGMLLIPRNFIGLNRFGNAAVQYSGQPSEGNTGEASAQNPALRHVERDVINSPAEALPARHRTGAMMSTVSYRDDPALLPPSAAPSASDLEDFFENGAVGLHLVGPDGTILKANKAELDLLGYTADGYIGRPISDFHADADVIADILERLKRGEKLDKYLARLRAKDGSIKHVAITSSAQFRNGKFINTRCFTIDVTDLRRAQDKLKENEQQMRQILEALPAAVYQTDAKGVITYYNPAAAELAGRSPEIGKDEWCVTWRIFTPDGKRLPHNECPMATALKENRAVRGVEAVAERPDGARVPFLPFPTPLRDSEGNLIGAVNMLVDISERRQAETHQRVLLDELNHRVKNNLQMIYSLLRVSERETTSRDAKAVLTDASQRIAAIAAAQKVLYNTHAATSFDAYDFVSAVCNSARQAFKKSVKIDISASGELSNEVSLPLALMLNELLTNAVKHGINGRGGGTITVNLHADADEWTLIVSDEGLGFDLRQTRRSASGLGLIVGLARQIGGTLTTERMPIARCIIRFPKTNARH